jgi:hypothetical protein
MASIPFRSRLSINCCNWTRSPVTGGTPQEAQYFADHFVQIEHNLFMCGPFEKDANPAHHGRERGVLAIGLSFSRQAQSSFGLLGLGKSVRGNLPVSCVDLAAGFFHP